MYTQYLYTEGLHPLLPTPLWWTGARGPKPGGLEACSPRGHGVLRLGCLGAGSPGTRRERLGEEGLENEMVREERNRGPRSVQLGLQPVRPVAPQEGEAVVVGVLRVENLGTWITVGLVPCKSQLTCGRWFERLFFYLVAFLPPDVLPFSIQ